MNISKNKNNACVLLSLYCLGNLISDNLNSKSKNDLKLIESLALE